MNQSEIVEAIVDAPKAEGFGDAKSRRDIAFHMTDWLRNLEEWHSFCQSPKTSDAASTMKLLIEFLVHVPNHVAAASKLLTDIPVTDVFGVGATAED